MVWYGVCGVVWCVWCGMVSCGVWCGCVVWYGVVWCIVWCVVWCGIGHELSSDDNGTIGS